MESPRRGAWGVLSLLCLSCHCVALLFLSAIPAIDATSTQGSTASFKADCGSYELPWRIESASHRGEGGRFVYGTRTSNSSSPNECRSSSVGGPPPAASVPDDHGPTVITLRSGEKAVVHGFSEPTLMEIALLVILCNAIVMMRFACICRRKRQDTAPSVGGPNGMPSLVVLLRVAVFESYFLYWLLHAVLLEVRHRPPAYEAKSLASEASGFLDMEGLRLHYLHKQPANAIARTSTRVVHASHGFGASSLSWHGVLGHLAHRLNAMALAHDAPGFGLTEVHHEEEDDHLTFGFHSSARLGHALREHAMQHMQDDADRRRTQRQQQQHIFIGHSMGTLTSSLMALEQLQRQQQASSQQQQGDDEAEQTDEDSIFLILEAPAILADHERTDLPVFLARLAHSVVTGEEAHQEQQQQCGEGEQPTSTGLLLSLAQAALSTVLRQSVYRPSFWSMGLTAAWTPDRRPDNHSITKYRLPSLKREWDRGLSRFILTCLRRSLAMGLGPYTPSQEEEGGEGQQRQRVGGVALVDRLASAAVGGGIKVLVVHGREDPVIPVSNSRQLVERIPGAKLLEVPGCGHIPHEEFPEVFMDAVDDFINSSSNHKDEGI